MTGFEGDRSGVAEARAVGWSLGGTRSVTDHTRSHGLWARATLLRRSTTRQGGSQVPKLDIDAARCARNRKAAMWNPLAQIFNVVSHSLPAHCHKDVLGVEGTSRRQAVHRERRRVDVLLHVRCVNAVLSNSAGHQQCRGWVLHVVRETFAYFVISMQRLRSSKEEATYRETFHKMSRR